MFSRIFGQRSPEKDIDRIVVDLHGANICRVVPLDVGWQINAGTESRYMKHSTAFQLSSGGNTRGDYAIDLQQLRFAAADVAGGEFSVILSNEENRIDPNCSFSSIVGAYNSITDDSDATHFVGHFNTADGNGWNIVGLGDAHDIENCTYGFFAIEGCEVIKGANSTGAVGIWGIGEGNKFIANVNDYPTYTGTFGLFNVTEGDVWYAFQYGEDCKAYGLGAPAGMWTLWTSQQGYQCFAGHVSQNFLFGANSKSYLPNAGAYYDGRIVLSGDNPNSSVNDATGYIGGFNQDSWFSQNDLITNWTVAWITSRFEFPIIEDSIWFFEAYIAGTEQGCANSYAWKIEGVVENDGGTTTILVSTVTNVYRDVATKEWQVIADDPNDRLVFQFRDTAGPDATDCNVQLRMMTAEVGFD